MTERYDRAAVMRDAWVRYRDGQRLGLGWTFGRCLSTAWAAAKMRRAGTHRMVLAAMIGGSNGGLEAASKIQKVL